MLTSLLLFAIAFQAQTPPPTASISGTVLESTTHSPIAGADIYLSPGGKHAQTNDKGNYEIKELNAGTYGIGVYSGPRGPHGRKFAQVASGQTLTVDFSLTPKASITGRVSDANGETIQGVEVAMVAREYRLGSLRYVYAATAETDDRGQYTLKGIEPGVGYLLKASRHDHYVNAASDAPADPKLRKKIKVPVWYPDSDSADVGQVLVLQPGEHREGMDMRLKSATSYCMDGVLASDKGPGPLSFFIEEQQPTSGESGDGGIYKVPPEGKAANDGHIRICDLHSGIYRLTAFDPTSFYGQTEVPVGDKDVHKVRVFGRPRIPITGEVAWDGQPPDQPPSAKLSLWFDPMTRAPFSEEINSTNNLPPVPIPGQFSVPGLYMDDYELKIQRVPAGAYVYVKDVVFGGLSARHEPVPVGKTAGSTLRILMAHDGGTVTLNVTDKDNKPIPDCQVVLLPETASTEASLADAMLPGQTDQNGTFTSPMLAPGKYFAIATTTPASRTPEALQNLLRLRAQAQTIDLQPNGSAQLTLQPIP